MKFGPVPISQAAGHILAHSIPLRKGRLRKGMVLQAEHIAALAEIGRDEVVVARLDARDVHEDEAAGVLARAAVGDAGALALSAPFTGRVNVLAQGPGVVRLGAQRIIAANEVDPVITIATVPDYHQIHAGGMVATIKVISYAVPRSAVEEAAARAQGAIALAPPIYRTASLIVTDVPGGLGDKGQAAIEARLTGLGLTLAETRRCPHEETALAREIAAARGEIVLVLTASATSDARDTAPEALRLAGGAVARFGIPVDPGNLLFLGHLGERPVIGLPGSARSPVLHGADWVLSRVACGIDITSRDFAAMGVGGLLKEIPTRPQPRQVRRG